MKWVKSQAGTLYNMNKIGCIFQRGTEVCIQPEIYDNEECLCLGMYDTYEQAQHSKARLQGFLAAAESTVSNVFSMPTRENLYEQ